MRECRTLLVLIALACGNQDTTTLLPEGSLQSDSPALQPDSGNWADRLAGNGGASPDDDAAGGDATPDAGLSRGEPPIADFECLPGNQRCDGRAHQRCANDGSGWITQALCARCETETTTTCDAETGCTGVLCCPGEISCRGVDLRRCSDGGDSWITIERCAIAAACDAETEQCLAPTCTAGERRCNDANGTVEECQQGVRWTPVETCATACLCLEGELDGNSFATCRSPICEAGEMTCREARLAICNACQTGFDLVLDCASAASCNAESGTCD